ncbi:hypothetical protein LCGC14_1955490 [marine sediment metagenome]|uniref:Ice-binding protein C-terminal domain-containing protein n=1 Tax=marine sediment metagenome TaxID=412755 RepID=A0A0F9FGF3_9ZZZZ
MRDVRIWVVVICAAVCIAVEARAADSIVYTVTQLRNAMNGADPGDRIYVAPGNYSSRLWVQDVHGEPGNMIQVLALDPDNRPVFTSNAASCITIYNSSYILMDGIIAYGGGTPTQGSNNIEFPYGHHMILKNSYSYDIDHNGNTDGVKFAHSDNILMYNTKIESWAEGGSAIDQMISSNSLMMRNTITFPDMSPDVAANGTQPKGESFENGYYKNTFIDGSSRALQFGGSGGALHWEAWDMVAMGNVIDGGEASVAYVSSTTSVFDYNTIVDPEIWIMRILREGGDQQTAYNTFRRNLIEYGTLNRIQNIGPNTRPETFDYANNYWYRWTNPGGSIPTLPGGETNPAGGTDPQLDAEYRPLYGPARAYGAHAPAMEAAWEPYTDWFAWAWAKALEYEPDAVAGGEYRVAPGLTVRLDAAASTAGSGSYGDHTITSWTWDIDGDGVFDDASGETVELSFDDLAAMGLSPGTHQVGLRISSDTEYDPIVDWDLADLTILAVLITGDVNLDAKVNVTDLGALAANWQANGPEIGWGHGDFTADHIVNITDLGAMASNWQVGVEIISVPEPASAALLALGALVMIRRRTRR